MKKKTIKLIAAIVLSVIAVGVLTSGIGSYVGVRTAKAAYYDNSKEKVKTCELDGIKTELTYVRTKIMQIHFSESRKTNTAQLTHIRMKAAI